MSKLTVFESERDALGRNRLLFDWLRDDTQRADLYAELKCQDYPVLRLKSLVRPDDSSPPSPPWPSEDLYVVSSQRHVAHALRTYSVAPYSKLDSGGRFMLGIDDPRTHDLQHDIAWKALRFEPTEVEAMAREAVRIAFIRPLKSTEFDVVLDIGRQAALRYVELLFNMPPEAHYYLQEAMWDTYVRLSYQIVGRHFVSDPGLPPMDSATAREALEKLDQSLAKALVSPRGSSLTGKGIPEVNVTRRLHDAYAPQDATDAVMVALGLMAGTIGNVAAAIAIAIEHFFKTPLIDRAIALARANDATALTHLINDALHDNPSAPFLTRTARGGGIAFVEDGCEQQIPDGALVLTALGADPDPDLMFGDGLPFGSFAHRCVGRHLAMPLILETVRQLLLLPGLARVVDPATGRPKPLVKRWGAVCQKLPLQFQLGRRLNHQPLHLALPIKEPTAVNAFYLKHVIEAGAHIVEDALAVSRHVHCAWFNISADGKTLSMSTMFDGDFDSYVAFFALLVPLFDVQFDYLDLQPPVPRPIRQYPNEFVAAIKQYNQRPIADYFYSAYPLATVADISNAGLDTSDAAASVSPSGPPGAGDAWHESRKGQVQRLVLTGYPSDIACHLVLKVTDAARARAFLRQALAERDVLTFGDSSAKQVSVNIGFTFKGLSALDMPAHHLDIFAAKSPAFADGAPVRAARFLGDAGVSAVERWDAPFALHHANVWIALHGNSEARIVERIARLRTGLGGDAAFTGWDSPMCACTLKPDSLVDGAQSPVRYVHFGLRDNISQPTIRSGQAADKHEAGELLLGYLNDEGFSFWSGGDTPPDVVRFAHNGSFGVLRKIEQDEQALSHYLAREAKRLQATHPFVTADWLKAKLCGRWPNGALVQPGEYQEPVVHPDAVAASRLDTTKDPHATGCPFGAHIRRANPRQDPIAPPDHLRTLFRRGMPYGPRYTPGEPPGIERGLLGGFFCASIEDQFERLVSEWIEKHPMGPRGTGNAKDPLLGHHDDPDAALAIPLSPTESITLARFEPFVRTRGTLYAFFPARAALETLAHGKDLSTPPAPWMAKPAPARSAASRTARPAPAPASDAVEPGGAPRDRFCDIVLEGGVTSGIIYATAVAELSHHYRFKNIGGSSIGAFAAALTAAAEYQRRLGSDAGFQVLGELPEKLATQDTHGRTTLRNLFAPQHATRRLFAIFIAALNRSGGASRAMAGIAEAFRQYSRPAAVLGVIALAVVVLCCCIAAIATHRLAPPAAATSLVWAELAPWWFIAAVSVLSAVVVGVLAGAAWDVVHGLVPNGFALCRGQGGIAPAGSPDLAAYMHGAIQLAAGRDPNDDLPLTFGDLWVAPGAPSDVFGYTASGSDAYSINLECYSANLAHSRPYRFPLDAEDDMGRLFFKAHQLEKYFPAPLVAYLVEVSVPYTPKNPADPEASDLTKDVRELPTCNLPIVVAARLAMSFPLLISAVPLWAIDHDPEKRADRGLCECWMSDGGLCSNFPIHLFDSWIPRWPTFGISLGTRSTAHPTREVWLPDFHRQGREDTWNHDLGSNKPSLGRLGAFLSAIWVTTWRWNDSTMMRMPGVRDRVVRVYLEPGEGGVNICMNSSQILQLSRRYGSRAARDFVEKFADPGSPGWPEHRWVRFNTLLVGLRERAGGLKSAAETARHTEPLPALIRSSLHEAPLRCAPGDTPGPSELPLQPDQVTDLQSLLAALESLEASFAAATAPKPFDAQPRPSLRIRHPT